VPIACAGVEKLGALNREMNNASNEIFKDAREALFLARPKAHFLDSRDGAMRQFWSNPVQKSTS
jgi:hypothetical protein